MVSTRRDFLNSLSAIIGSSFLLTDSMLAKTIGNKKIHYPDILADQYFLKKESSYLNHASIGTVPKVVHNAHVKYLEICESNPDPTNFILDINDDDKWNEFVNGCNKIKIQKPLLHDLNAVSYTHLRAHETREDRVLRGVV